MPRLRTKPAEASSGPIPETRFDGLPHDAFKRRQITTMVNDRRLEVLLALQRGEIEPKDAHLAMTAGTRYWHPWARAFAESVGQELAKFPPAKTPLVTPDDTRDDSAPEGEATSDSSTDFDDVAGDAGDGSRPGDGEPGGDV